MLQTHIFCLGSNNSLKLNFFKKISCFMEAKLCSQQVSPHSLAGLGKNAVFSWAGYRYFNECMHAWSLHPLWMFSSWHAGKLFASVRLFPEQLHEQRWEPLFRQPFFLVCASRNNVLQFPLISWISTESQRMHCEKLIWNDEKFQILKVKCGFLLTRWCFKNTFKIGIKFLLPIAKFCFYHILIIAFS